MNYLKECPQLFANGEFKIEIKGDGTYNIEVLDGIWLDRFKRYGVENITLIARPISDMTKEEYIEMFPHRAKASYNKDALIGLERRADMGKLMFSEVRYLLAFGIYIGTQEDFRDGIILDAKKIDGL